MVMSGRSNGSLVGSTCGGQLGRLVVDDLGGGERLRGSAEPGISLPVSGNEVTRLPPTLISARMLPAAISSGSTGARPFVDECLRLGPAARAGTERSLDRGDRQQIAESFELVSESGMEPRAAGAVHRAGEDHQHPGQPLGDIGPVGRHRDAGPGFDRDAFGAAHRRAQPRQLGLGARRRPSRCARG